MTKWFVLPALACLVFASCATSEKNSITRLSKEQRLTQPPTGKTLVNFHRVTSYGGIERYPIFTIDGRFVCDLPGHAGFQYICNSGEQVFIGWADQVSVVKVELAPNKVYDVMVDVGMGWMHPNIKLLPMAKTDPRRAKLSEFETRENLVTFTPNQRVIEYEARQQQRVADIKRDFLSGEKAERVRILSKDDCR